MQTFRLFFSFVVLVVLSACGESDTPPKENPKPSAKSDTKPGITRREAAKIGSYQRSPFSDNVVSGSRPPARNLTTADADEAASIAALQARVTPTMPKEEAVGVITEARAYSSEKLVDLTKTLLQHADPEIRGYSLTMVEGFDSPAVLPLVTTGLKDTVPDVRLQALEVLRYVHQDSSKPIYKTAIQDADPNVRMLAFSNALELSDDFKKEVVQENAASPIDDLARSSMAYLEADLNKGNVETFIRGLDHKNELIKDQVYERMYMLFGQKFKSATEAQAWWKKNQADYDENLLPLSLTAPVSPK